MFVGFMGLLIFVGMSAYFNTGVFTLIGVIHCVICVSLKNIRDKE